MKGRMVKEGEHATLTFERLLSHPPEDVWDAITRPEELAEWLMVEDARIDGRVGGSIDMVSGPGKYRTTGKILAWDPPRLFEYEWKVAPVAEMPNGEDAIFRYELFEKEGATLLVVTYRRITARTAGGFLPGTHALLDRLAAQLAGRPLPDWMSRFRELCAEYPEWSY